MHRSVRCRVVCAARKTKLIRRDVVKKVLSDQGMPRPSRSATDPAPASGLAWYTNADGIWPAAPADAFAGAGASHQVIVAAPSLDLIVVRNGDALGDTASGFWGPVYELVVKPLMEAVSVQAPYPPSIVIRHAVFGKEIRRRAIDSDNWPLTWGDDDAQYTSYGDGFGFEPHVEKKLGMGFARITGGPGDYRGANLRSDGERTGGGVTSPKASGILDGGWSPVRSRRRGHNSRTYCIKSCHSRRTNRLVPRKLHQFEPW